VVGCAAEDRQAESAGGLTKRGGAGGRPGAPWGEKNW